MSHLQELSKHAPIKRIADKSLNSIKTRSSRNLIGPFVHPVFISLYILGCPNYDGLAFER